MPVARPCEYDVLSIRLQCPGDRGRQGTGGEAARSVQEGGDARRRYSGVQATPVLRDQAGREEAEDARGCEA